MKELRRKILLPVFQLSELTTADDPRARRRAIKQGKGYSALTYHYRFIWDALEGRGFNYNLFPVVLDKNSAPWHLGMLYILSLLEADTNPAMKTYQNRADDLGAYKEWLDTQNNPDDLVYQFPKITLRRPTYRYFGYLQQKIQAGELKPKTAKRRMRTVVTFYRWLIANHYFKPEHAPWEETKYKISFKTIEGRALTKNIFSTDVSIRAPESEDPLDGNINDGGKLRPLNGKEQSWILEATKAKGNSECYLIQLFILATGARIQTVGTLRLRHFLPPNPSYAKSLTGEGEVFKLKAGPGTGIDTKNSKNGVLQIPRPIYELLHTYAISERAKIRRKRFIDTHCAHLDPYLFLTQQGNPYYTAQSDSQEFNPDFNRRYENTGQTVRQFIKDHIIPYVRKHHDNTFHYRIHDLRASFGMNMTEQLMDLVQKKAITLNQARMTIKDLLWHDSFDTTEDYLNYRSKMDCIYQAVNGYGEQLQKWIDQAMKSVEVVDE